MAKKNTILSFFLLFSCTVLAQQFTFVDAGIVNVGRSSVAWGDYDNDGDLDALITGDHGSGSYVASVYRNDAGEFVNINADLTGIYNSAVAWGDYDNDGDLDILACGRNSSNSKTYIYQNNNGAFVQKEAGLPNIGSDGAVAWGDYDGDGDLDILIAGAYSCKVFTNNGGVFSDANFGLPAVSNCWVDWGDFDNDGDLDIFVMGDLGGILVSSIYRNDKSTFTEMSQSAITPLAGGSSAWCDFDHDRDLDLLITGFNEYLEPQTSIFSNLGNMEFMNVFPGLIGASLGTAAWGDYDNDGETDILLTGQNAGCGILSSMVYHNDGNTTFTDINAPLEGAERGSAAWGDYDNDGDLDLLISGITGAGSAATRLYANTNGSNTFSANQPPTVPEGLSWNIDAHSATLRWTPATDDRTPTNGLTYNLRIGTTSGAQDVLPAMSNPLNGKLLLPKSGNAGNNADLAVNLPDGTYFWSVQAIDNSFAASEFSDEKTLTILNVGEAEHGFPGIEIFPNPVSDFLEINASGEFDYEITALDGRVLKKKSSCQKPISFDLSDCASGVYLLKMNNHHRVVFRKIIKI